MKQDHPKSIQILDQRVYRGPNRYDYGRGILLVVDIGDLEEMPTKKLPGFTDDLLDLIPSLRQHTCSYDEPGGLVRRMTEEEGTWLGHVFEHVALEIQSLAGVNVTYGKTRQKKGAIGRTGKESIYRVYFEHQNEETALEATKLALRVVNHLVDSSIYDDFNYKEELKSVIRTAERYAYGPSTGSIVTEAESRGIPSIRLRKRWSLVQFGWGNKQKRIWASTSTNSSYISVEIAQDKELTLQMLYDVGIPVPRGGVAETEEEALQEADRAGFPVVTKPLDVSHGRGVTLNISDEEELKRGFAHANEYASSVIVERYVEGNDYRVLVINGQFVAAAQRVPAHVVGDGEHTVKELVDIVNKDPKRGVGHEKVLTQITIDENAKRLLEEQELTLQSVPEKDRFVQLKSTANLSTGGTATDVTDVIHFDNIQLAERAVKTIGLDIAGVDIITKDITKPIKMTGGCIIEVNAAPGFRMHLEPTEGVPRNVAKPVVDMLFPDNSDGRIPLISITGTNGKTTVTRWVSYVLKLAGMKVGYTTTDGIYIDGTLEYTGDCTGPWSAKAVLRDPTIDIAVLETARGGILREGLGWDYCDVGALLNVSDDHLGNRGVNSLREMADVKGVILDQVREDGFGILNADDPLVMDQMGRVSGRVILISLDHENELIREHIKQGNTAITITPNGVIQLIQGQSQTSLIHVNDIPATFNGNAIFNIQNALFVIASVLPYISIEDIRTGLTSFSMSFTSNPGRMNVENVKGAQIILDYGHNPAALEAQIQLVDGLHQNQGGSGRKAIVFGMPGDRPNETILEAAANVAGNYDRYFIKEDWNLRGREPKEVPNLIVQGLKQDGAVSDEQIEVIAGDKNELDAVKRMYDWIKLNDVILLQADDIAKVREYLFVELEGRELDEIQKKTMRVRGQGEPENPRINYAKFLKAKRKRLDETSD